MSTNPVLVPISLVSQYLANEKMASRHWLQCQMECLLDQVFDQLSTKFEDYLASNAITGTAHHTTIDSGTFQHEPSFQAHSYATTDHLIDTEFPVVGQSHNQMMNVNGQMNVIHYDALIFDKALYPLSLSVPTSNQEQSNQNDKDDEYGLDVGDDQSLIDDFDDNAARVDSGEAEVKEELEDTNNELITSSKVFSSLSTSPSKGQSNQIKCEVEDDCDECLNKIEVKEEDGDNDHVQIIEDNDGPSHPKKKPRIDTTQTKNRQSLVPRQSSRLNQIDQFDNKQTEPNEEENETNEIHNQDKQIITLSRQCHQNDCSLMFNNKTELNLHMNAQHGTLLFRCFVKDCNQSFNTQHNMRDHINQVHSSTTQWPCNKCSKHYPTYAILYRHNYHYHHIGQYQCASPDCTFTAEHRQKVYNHYNHQHKVVQLICQHPNCARRFNDRSNFRKHQMIHLGIKPFRCNWPSCGYGSAHKRNTISHIKKKHLSNGSTETLQVDDHMTSHDPREYLVVVS